jgi:Fe(3+) dicitrate transport protein
VDRDDESGKLTYADDRKTRYGAIFAENVFRLPYFHIVTSARFDHEELASHETVANHPLLVDRTYRKNVPLFGIGIGNDFGRGNETYLNVSQGFRPLRYLDIASPFSNYASQNNPDPTKYVTYELGVHGWPAIGLYYDVSLFQVNVHDRIESQQFGQIPGQSIDVNTGNTRSRGAEMEGSYDVLRLLANSAADQHLTIFANASLLNARFTNSALLNQTGKTPAYAPAYVLKAGATLRRDGHYKVSLVVDSVASQFFQDSNQPILNPLPPPTAPPTVTPTIATPARIPTYTVADLSGEYTVVGGLRLLAGVANLTNRLYYSRVFISRGQLEPGRDRTFYAGVGYDF